VYVIIGDSQRRIAIVRTSRGAYLPGGGVEGTETPAAAAAREAREECGLDIRVGAWRAWAIDHVDAPDEDTHYEKRSVFYEGVELSPAIAPLEPDHELSWLPVPDALELLSPPSHRWALGIWHAQRGGSSDP
jgi:8-oxo-dGTP diphosphatase